MKKSIFVIFLLFISLNLFAEVKISKIRVVQKIQSELLENILKVMKLPKNMMKQFFGMEKILLMG